MFRALALSASLLAAGCGEQWNNPYPGAERGSNVAYAAFTDRPKHLDPALSYASDEWDFISQIYEPPLQYHYLKRPYELIPQSAVALPVARLLDAGGRELPSGAPAERVAWSEYVIEIRKGVLYQPHPAFARGVDGKAQYLDLAQSEIRGKYRLADFVASGTRELTAEDYVYQIKRLAHPRASSPILGHMSEYIVGLRQLAARLAEDNQAVVAAHAASHGPTDRGYPWLDLRPYRVEGAQALDRYRYRIRIKGKYPQFVYWLAMPFFAPMPWEADAFYSQRGMNEGRNLTLDWYPVGTGPYMLVENDPNARMVLERNPNFRGEAYPSEGEAGDRDAGLLADAGRTAPFIDRVVFAREREGIPYWNKFLQGYYDQSGIGSDNFDQAVRVGLEGEAALTPEMEAKGIGLRTSVGTSTFYLAFNFLDPVVGGTGDETHRSRSRKLRQAIAIAIDWEEFISIFQNGRGIPAHGPLPPGIFGYREGPESINAQTHEWAGGQPRRRSVEAARKLLAEAGYADGRDAASGQPLVLNLDTVGRGPGDKARLDWYRRQFAKLNLQLEIRTTDWNRFQEKIRQGNTQIFFLGWNADYPDPENFMFLLNGPQSRAKGGGENAANYANPEFDRLFERMRNMDNGAERQAIIDRMVRIYREDAPWAGGLHPKDYGLTHAWMKNVKPNHMARNGMKFHRVDPAQREQRRSEWNRPKLWPLGLALLALCAALFPAWAAFRRRERLAARPVP